MYTVGMIGYGMAKAAVHQLVHSLSQHGSGLPKDTTVVGILPITLDTPANRAAMAGADFSQWTPLDFVARWVYVYLFKQCSHPRGREVFNKGKLKDPVTEGFFFCGW